MRRREPDASSVAHASERWQTAAAGRRYRSSRWRTARAARRDLLIVQRALRRHGVEPTRGAILDAPCGTGRLLPVLAATGSPYVGLDVSSAMLAEFEGGEASPAHGRLVQGSVARMPFRNDAFDVVVACRLLHHAHDEDELAGLVHELVRVSGRLVVASFWDASSLPALRKRIGLRRDEGPGGRRPLSKPIVRSAFEAAGAEVVAVHHSFRFVSQQTFLVANKRARIKELRPATTTLLRLADEAAGYGAGSALGGA
jgi:SAM-dependent methyltransferase